MIPPSHLPHLCAAQVHTKQRTTTEQISVTLKGFPGMLCTGNRPFLLLLYLQGFARSVLLCLFMLELHNDIDLLCPIT